MKQKEVQFQNCPILLENCQKIFLEKINIFHSDYPMIGKTSILNYFKQYFISSIVYTNDELKYQLNIGNFDLFQNIKSTFIIDDFDQNVFYHEKFTQMVWSSPSIFIISTNNISWFDDRCKFFKLNKNGDSKIEILSL